MTPMACGICGGQPEALFDKAGWPVGRCTGCGLIYVTRQPTREELDSAYGEGYFTDQSPDGYRDYMHEDWRVPHARRRVAAVAREVPNGRMLEVGAASGLLLNEARAHGFDVMGVELSDYASAHARERYGLDVRTGDIADFDLGAASFDVVVSFDTIEHVADPQRNVAEMARLVRPGGLAVISTGDVTRVRDLENWRLMYPPLHLFYFTRSTLTDLLHRHGLVVTRVEHTGQIGQSARMMSLPWRIKRLGHRLGLGDEMVVYARKG
jgi:2-polyprenyl-3-methyl-5-hydroxy-6-metoxy-1,4-benzoquinol methylase